MAGLGGCRLKQEYRSAPCGLRSCGEWACHDGLVTRALRWIVLALVVIWPAFVVALATAQGIALSQDSTSYLAGADAFASWRGVLDIDGETLTLFPPGLPVLLGGISLVGPSVPTAGVIINVLSVPLIVIGAFVAGLLVLRSWWWALAAAGMVGLSTTFTGVFVWLWTEPAFTVLVVAALVALLWGVVGERAPWWLVIAVGILASLATTVRYVGYVLIPVAALGLWWASRTLARRSRWLRVGAVVVIALIAPVAIGLRNVSEGAGPLGERYPGSRTMQDSVVDAVRVLGEYVLPPATGPWGIVLGTVAVLLALVAAWVALVRRDRAVLLLTAFTALYFAVIVWGQSATRLDSPSARLLAPLLPALAILVVAGARLVLARLRSDAGALGGAPLMRVGIVVVAAGVALLVVANVRGDIRLISDGRAGTLGLASGAATSALLTEARSQGASGVASNDPWAVYLALGAPALPLPPSPAEWPEARVERDRAALVAAVRSGAVTHAVVVDPGAAVDAWEPLEAAGVRAVLVAEAAEGRVYRLDPLGP